jgi:hypothetical protein
MQSGFSYTCLGQLYLSALDSDYSSTTNLSVLVLTQGQQQDVRKQSEELKLPRGGCGNAKQNFRLGKHVHIVYLS